MYVFSSLVKNLGVYTVENGRHRRLCDNLFLSYTPPNKIEIGQTGMHRRELLKMVIVFLKCCSPQLMASGREQVGKHSVFFKGLPTHQEFDQVGLG